MDYTEATQAIADLPSSDDIKFFGFYGSSNGATDIGDTTNLIPAYFGPPSDPNYSARRMNTAFVRIKGDQGIAEKRQATKADSVLGTNIQGNNTLVCRLLS